MMFPKRPIRAAALVLLVGLLLACGLPALSRAPSAASSPATAVAFTQTALALQQTQVALELTRQAPSLLPPTQPPAPTQPPPGGTASAAPPTPTAPPPPSTTPPPSTPTPAAGLAGTANGNIYCRTGPAPYYPAVDTLKAGDRVTVVGRPAEGTDYWLIRSPRGETCWVWGRWFQVAGDASTLPVATAPPPPPGAASLWLLRQDTCGGGHYLVFSILNQGPEPIESFLLRVKDLPTGTEYDNVLMPSGKNGFYRCADTLDKVLAHQKVEVWLAIGAADLKGHMLRVTLQTCTADNLQGECIARAPFNVTVP